MSTRDFDFALAGASGLLLALSFPKFGHPAFGWIALAPLVLALTSGGSLLRGFALGLTTGVIYFTGTLYWVSRVMVVYGDLQLASAVVINALLIAYMALFPALFALGMRRLIASYGTRALLTAPLVWVATELGRTYLLTGFPWVLLGYSQATVLPIAQLASVVGVYGVSALVASVSAALVVSFQPSVTSGFGAHVASGFDTYVASGFSRMGPVSRRGKYAPAAGVLALVGIVAFWGARRAANGDLMRQGQAVRVGLVQGNIDQGEKFDASRAAAIVQQYLNLTRQAIAEGAEIVMWPESSAPFFFEEDLPGAERVRTIARQAHVPILLGSDQIEWRAENGRRIPDKYFNSAFLVRADGSTAGVYRKIHLVPFGEYVPLARLLFFAGPIVEKVGTFHAGADPALLPVKGHRISVAICYEVVYPNLIREFVVRGSELLTTITNDAWFGRTSAPYQHFEQASMRAIEEGRYLVRSANTGISGIVDPYGRVLERSDIFQQVVIVGQARFLQATTVYARIGDAFAYLSVVLTLMLLVTARRRVQ